jgi:hypothetical protein
MKEVVVVYLKVLSRNSPTDTEKSQDIRVSGRDSNGYLLNTSRAHR